MNDGTEAFVGVNNQSIVSRSRGTFGTRKRSRGKIAISIDAPVRLEDSL